MNTLDITILIVVRSLAIESGINHALEPFGISLSSRQLEQVQSYTDLLLRWSKAINLTAIRDRQQILTRHFGESMYLTRLRHLEGSLLDVGSGAGFPGLALKICVPALNVTLLEPNSKKRAFLKEVTRTCELDGVQVLGERVEDFAIGGETSFESATVRAVGSFRTVLRAVFQLLSIGGELYLWLAGREAGESAAPGEGFDLYRWSAPIPIPLSRDRQILCGTPRG